jgi:phosphatidylserine decarboxylase
MCSLNIPSRLAGRLAEAKLPTFLLRPAIAAYCRLYGVDMAEALRRPDEFETFADFFVRELKPGLRPVADLPDGLVSPSDGRLHNFGRVDGGTIPQIKGHDYSVAELLLDEKLAGRFAGGAYATIYLSPRNYHRVHSPADGRIVQCRHIPGSLFGVSPAFVNHVGKLFCGNERMAILLSTAAGLVAVVMVGAAGVGRITLTFAGLTTNSPVSADELRSFEPPLPIRRGEELGAFRLGSTVVLLTERPMQPHLLAEGMPLRMGAALFRA